MIGFISLDRSIMDWEWYQHPIVSRLYIHLILKANFKEKKWQGFVINRGQLVTSVKSLSSELIIPEQSIRTALNKLEDSGCIVKKVTNRFSVITIVNYSFWQGEIGRSNKRMNTLATTQLTSKQQSTNNQLTTTKEGNKEKHVNNVKERKEFFKNQVFEHTDYDEKILNDFFNYWSEISQDGKKMKWEGQKYFEVTNRLKGWKPLNDTSKFQNNNKPKFSTNR